ncbi:MAG TPA: hypothetical protein VHR88_05385 [Solirubrobacteraceae bacterium]|nr:hypothetical protein [Solirubrobacteraceae bacterium]
MILGLDRLLARVRGRGREERVEEEAPPGPPARDDEVGERIDAARVRLREQIPPIEDPPD